VPRKAGRNGKAKGGRLTVRVLGSPSPEALKQAYSLVAKKLVRELTRECGRLSTSE
jgi:hypothetical protein